MAYELLCRVIAVELDTANTKQRAVSGACFVTVDWFVTVACFRFTTLQEYSEMDS